MKSEIQNPKSKIQNPKSTNNRRDRQRHGRGS
jgi:hypothetical protein